MSAITLSGVQVLVGSALLVLLGAVILLWQTSALRRTSGLRHPEEHLSSRARIYFALLGLAYLLVQLALHQRLAIVLGHPTPTLALVIATMLLGTGLGSRLAGTGSIGRSPRILLLWPVTAVGALTALFSTIGRLSSAPSLGWTAFGAGTMSLLVGAALGVALPTGIRLLAPTEQCVAEAWAVNGAFSVAGASLGALAGITLGSHGLAALALPCYAGIWIIGWLETRNTDNIAAPQPVGTAGDDGGFD